MHVCKSCAALPQGWLFGGVKVSATVLNLQHVAELRNGHVHFSNGSITSLRRCLRLVRLPLNCCRTDAVQRNDGMCQHRKSASSSDSYSGSPALLRLLARCSRSASSLNDSFDVYTATEKSGRSRMISAATLRMASSSPN